MSTERWNDDRLDSLADRVENIAAIADSNARVIQFLANVAAEARQERDQLFQLIAQQQASIERQQASIERQQAEIVDLRTETQRMLEILLNQHNQVDNPTS